MNIIEFIAQDVFDKVRGRFTNLEMGDEQGTITTNPKDARFFDFDFVIEGNNLGRVSVSIHELGTLKVFYSQGITEDVDTITLNEWYEFLREMRYFAKRRMLRFDTRDITKSNLNKNDFQYLAQTGTKENNMNESAMIGRGPKTSMRKLENTRLIVRHSKVVDETQKGARSRNINALYIENADGERFKYPFIHLAGAKAMQRHVANGGRPYDEMGKEIINLSEKISQLVAFKRHVGHHDGMNTEVNEILERSQGKLNELRKTVEGLCGQKFYEQWAESFQPSSDEGFVLDQATMEDYKDKFTQKNFKEDLTQYFPLIHKIMQETSTIDLTQFAQEEQVDEVAETQPVDDFAQFESWTVAVTEGTLEPDTIMALKDLLDNGLTYGGPDATGAIEALQGIGIQNDALENALKANAELNPEGDPKEVIMSWLMKDDPEAAQELSGQAAAPAPAPEPAAAPAPEPAAAPAPVPAEEPVAEGASDYVGNAIEDLRMSKPGLDRESFLDELYSYIDAQYGKRAADAAFANEDDDMFDDWYDSYNDAMEGVQEGEEDMENQESKPQGHTPSMKEIVEFIKPFYNKNAAEQGLGEWRKGPTELGIMASKQFGDRVGQLVEKYVERMQAQTQAMRQEQAAFEDIMQLAGIQKEGIKDVAKKVGGAVKKAAGKALDTLGHGSDDDLIKDLQKKVGAPQHGKKSMAQPNESIANEDFDIVLKLAGISKK